MEKFSKIISNIFLWIMNIGLLIIGVLLSFGLLSFSQNIKVQKGSYCKGISGKSADSGSGSGRNR